MCQSGGLWYEISGICWSIHLEDVNLGQVKLNISKPWFLTLKVKQTEPGILAYTCNSSNWKAEAGGWKF